MGETKYHYTYEIILILILCYLEPLQIVAQLWHDWDIFNTVSHHHSPDFILPSEALETIKLTLFVRGPDRYQLPF